MVKAAGGDDDRAFQLVDAVDCKATNTSDENALNQTVAKVFTERDLAKLLGDLNELEEDDSEDEA